MTNPSSELPDLTGKTVLITGASSGIGAVAARRLSEVGARVLVQGRSVQRTAEIAEAVGAEPMIADFARLDEVRSLAEHVLRTNDRLDVVLHNAGALVPRPTRTVDGHELTFQANHLAPFLLQLLLTDLIAGTPGARVVVTGSGANQLGKVNLDDLDRERRRCRPFLTYSTSKLENILFVLELAWRLSGRGVTAVSFNPGAVATNFGAGSTFPGVFYRTGMSKYYLLSETEGAAPLIWLATRADVARTNGVYFDRFKPNGRTSRQARDAGLARELWLRSEEMVRPWL